MTFTSITDNGPDTIRIFPESRRAVINFRNGEIPLSGVPTDYLEYYVTLPPPLHVASIDSILQWKRVQRLSIRDVNGVALRLSRRIDELKQMTDLGELQLCIQGRTYSRIKVARFIDNLPSLQGIVLTGVHMTKEDMKRFIEMSDIPSNWKTTVFNAPLQVHLYKVPDTVVKSGLSG